MKKFLEILRFLLQTIETVQRDKATRFLEFELQSQKHAFALLTLGSLTGHPSVPLSLTMRLLPYLEKELLLMLQRENTDDELARIASVFEIE